MGESQNRHHSIPCLDKEALQKPLAVQSTAQIGDLLLKKSVHCLKASMFSSMLFSLLDRVLKVHCFH
jgi:hypothetical protein